MRKLTEIFLIKIVWGVIVKIHSLRVITIWMVVGGGFVYFFLNLKLSKRLSSSGENLIFLNDMQVGKQLPVFKQMDIVHF